MFVKSILIRKIRSC